MITTQTFVSIAGGFRDACIMRVVMKFTKKNLQKSCVRVSDMQQFTTIILQSTPQESAGSELSCKSLFNS
jgi:hypothetical protein